jgi:hypothetical protein
MEEILLLNFFLRDSFINFLLSFHFYLFVCLYFCRWLVSGKGCLISSTIGIGSGMQDWAAIIDFMLHYEFYDLQLMNFYREVVMS